MKQQFRNIPVFIPELACPHQCVFCDQKKISGRLNTPGIEEIKQTIDNHLATIDNENTIVEIAFFGGNFTGLDLADQKIYLDLAEKYVEQGLVNGVRMSTRPDYIDEQIIEILNHYTISTIELGAQSFDEEVLKKSGRGHTANDTINAAGLIKEAGFSLGLQMMTGLPASTPAKEIETVAQIVKLGADNTRIYPALVIKGTKLEELYLAGKFRPQSMDDAVNICRELVKKFEAADITILKLGLHPSEGLLFGDDLVAGPFHQSFRELVLSAIWKEKFEQFSFNDCKSCVLEVPADQFNYAVGYNASNKKMLMKKFANVKFVANNLLKGREFNVIYS